ncbi:hypothetical protein CAEBREN_14347 [Caenorhabditis brenneri]|uniref:Homeobox domain-containing protein n=1 Tax=Caenorhabditis brenneri TaxID=135651 RepID=G0MCA9_CAEBE|nr:hypothetical protein CAEBREN_14347 [Caenorhabditis brenneri]
MMRDLSDPMRDLSVSDSRSDSSSSPPILPSSSSSTTSSSAMALHNAQAFWAQNLGEQASFQFGSMMYPNITSQMTCTSNTNNSTGSTTPLHQTSTSTTSSSASSSNNCNMFDFSTAAAAQQQYLYQAAGYGTWGYPAYNFQYPAIYGGSDGDFKDFKDVTLLPATTRSSSSTTPTATSTSLTSLGWTMTHEGKKKRQPYKKDQISRLEYEYTVNPYLTNKRRAELSNQLMLDEKQVKVWFQNRRMKDKKLKQRVAGPFPLGAPVTPSYERLIN